MAPRPARAYSPGIVKHVLLSAFTPMLQSIIVDALSSRPDVSLIAADQAHAAGDAEIDVVLTAAPDPTQVDALMDLLWRWPRSRVVVVSTSGRTAVLYELVPRKQTLGDLCPATLVDAVCGERR